MSGPTRSCLACRQRDSKASLHRFTIASGTIVADPSATKPGRGAYLCHQQSCLDAAMARGAVRLLGALRARGSQVAVDEQTIRTAHSSNTEGRTARGPAQVQE